MSKFNFNIDIENNELRDSLSKSKYNPLTLKELYEFSLYVVNLGLPSGTIWAKYNLGVDPNKLSKSEDWYGDYYAWGEIIPNKPDGYNWKTYQFDKDLIKYNKEDNLTELQFMDDGAYNNIHLHDFKFKMPTEKLFEELLKYTTNKLIKTYKNIKGLNGRLFRDKNGNELFMPAAACSGSSGDVGVEGYYWSSSLNAAYPDGACCLCFDDEGVDMYSDMRYYGFSVRPVLNLS